MLTVCLNGKTRIVILTDKYAFKIARFRFIRPFVRLFELLILGGVRENVVRHSHKKVFWRGALNYLFYGVAANLREYKRYKKYGDDSLLVPTLFTLFGLVNVQMRGYPVVDLETFSTEGSSLLSILREDHACKETDVLRSDQFCVIGGKLLLADYGHGDLEGILVRAFGW